MTFNNETRGNIHKKKYFGRKRKAVGFVFLHIYKFHHTEGKLDLFFCMHDDVINAAIIIRKCVDKNLLYR